MKLLGAIIFLLFAYSVSFYCDKQVSNGFDTLRLSDTLLYVGEFRVTAYSADSASCFPYNDGFTATMVRPIEGITVASDWAILAPGVWIRIIIDSVEYIRQVQDRGGAIKGNRLDLYFDSPLKAKNFGVKKGLVWIITKP